MACLAAASLDVEREPSGTIAAHLRFGRLGEQRADFVPYSRIGGGIGTRSAADRILVDVDHLVALVHAFHARVLAGHDARAVQLVRKHRIKDLVDQRGFAGTGHARHAGEHAQREIDVQVLEVVLAGSDHAQLLGLMRLAACGGHFDLPSAGDVVAGDGAWRFGDFSGGAGIHDLAAMFAGARTDVDDPVRVSDGVLVMFDDDQRVAEVAQMMQCADQPFVVTLMQADGWFVQHIHDAHQAGADLGGQSDALRLAARQGLRRTRQRQIVQADIVEEAESCADLLDDFAGYLRGRAFEF